MKRATVVGLAAGMVAARMLRRYVATGDFVAVIFGPIVAAAARSAIIGRERSAISDRTPIPAAVGSPAPRER